MPSLMPTPTYTSIALLGAGSIGVFLDAFVSLKSKGVKTIVLARKSAKQKPFPEETTIVPIADYFDTEEVCSVLKSNQIQLVVSTIGVDGLGAVQKAVANAAKKAGVELFVPSEFGLVSECMRGEGLIALKQEVADHLKGLKLPFLRIFTGIWYMYIKDLTGYTTTGKVNVVLSGDEEFTFTSEDDVANFTAYVVTSLPPVSLHNRTMRIQGDKVTLKEVASLLNALVIKVDEVPQGEGKYDGIMTFLQKYSEGGKASSGYIPNEGKEGAGENAASSANKLWEGHRFMSLKNYLGSTS